MDTSGEKKQKLEQQIEEIRTQIVKLKVEEQRTTDPKQKANHQQILKQLESEKEAKQQELADLDSAESRSEENAIEIHIQTD